jgi:hypothetical protein
MQPAQVEEFYKKEVEEINQVKAEYQDRFPKAPRVMGRRSKTALDLMEEALQTGVPVENQPPMPGAI